MSRRRARTRARLRVVAAVGADECCVAAAAAAGAWWCGRRCLISHGSSGPSSRGLCVRPGAHRLVVHAGGELDGAECALPVPGVWTFVAAVYNVAAGATAAAAARARARPLACSHICMCARARALTPGTASIMCGAASPLVTVRAATVDPPPSAVTARLGASYDGPGLPASFDDVFIYARALDADELFALSLGPAGVPPPADAMFGYAVSFSAPPCGASPSLQRGYGVVASALGLTAVGSEGASAMTVAAWIAPEAPTQLNELGAPTLPTLTLVSKSSAATGAGCTNNEYAIQLISAPDAAAPGAPAPHGVALRHVLRVRLGTSDDGRGWAVDWPTGVTIVGGATWTHVAVAWDASTIRVVLNGTTVAVASRDAAPGVPACPRPRMVLGAAAAADGPDGVTVMRDYFIGSMDDVAVWNAALSDEEIADAAAGGVESRASVRAVAWWTFDDCTSVVTASSVGAAPRLPLVLHGAAFTASRAGLLQPMRATGGLWTAVAFSGVTAAHRTLALVIDVAPSAGELCVAVQPDAVATAPLLGRAAPAPWLTCGAVIAAVPCVIRFRDVCMDPSEHTVAPNTLGEPVEVVPACGRGAGHSKTTAVLLYRGVTNTSLLSDAMHYRWMAADDKDAPSVLARRVDDPGHVDLRSAQQHMDITLAQPSGLVHMVAPQRLALAVASEGLKVADIDVNEGTGRMSAILSVRPASVARGTVTLGSIDSGADAPGAAPDMVLVSNAARVDFDSDLPSPVSSFTSDLIDVNRALAEITVVESPVVDVVQPGAASGLAFREVLISVSDDGNTGIGGPKSVSMTTLVGARIGGQPLVTRLSPIGGSARGGTLVTLVVSNLGASTSVVCIFGGAAPVAALVTEDATVVTCVSPAAEQPVAAGEIRLAALTLWAGANGGGLVSAPLQVLAAHCARAVLCGRDMLTTLLSPRSSPILVTSLRGAWSPV